jgi:adenine-specific DNA-methyltransferase
LLTEDKDHNQREENKNSQNLLIKGDNLEVLKHMVNAYSEKVKMIYIDPPYNTGKDGFVYNDDREFALNELSELFRYRSCEVHYPRLHKGSSMP